MTTNGDADPAARDESRQLGQLFMMGFDGTTVNDQIKVLIEEYHIGSVLLTAKNLESAAQTTQLVHDLQTLAHNAGHPTPLLIAIDQENGGVNSLFDEVCIRQFPSAMGIAATGSKSMAKHISRATAQELGACGINWILGPVMDVLTNAKSQPLGVRSFGDDPVEVSSYAVECLKGYQEGGLATCGKHFPSYGNLEFFDGPEDVPTITDTLEHLSQNALVPFRHSISQGLDAMMVGGVAMSSANINVMHACLSEQVIHDLLRKELRFEGVVVSECLEMEALSRNIGISGGTVMAFNAGCDLILTCRSIVAQQEAINGLRSGLVNGAIEQNRVTDSVHRILAMKSRYVSWKKALKPPGVERLTKLQSLHTNLSTTAYNKSITVVRDKRGYLPISRLVRPSDELLLLTPLVRPLPTSAISHSSSDEHLTPGSASASRIGADSIVFRSEQVFQDFGKSLAKRRHGRLSHASYTANGLRPQHEHLLERASAVILVTADAGRNMYQRGFAKHISTLCKFAVGPAGQIQEIPCVTVAVSSPFDLVADPSFGTYICTYDFTETALQALVRVLFGDVMPTGSLPGLLGQGPKHTPARQRWLVEEFKEERDTGALDTLIQAVQSADTSSSGPLRNANAGTFLLQDNNIHESHFVVRNSTTKDIFGFCATYSTDIDQAACIGSIFVHPSRRKLSIGRSLHDRAVRALMQRDQVENITLGCRFPNTFAGLPDTSEPRGYRLKQWFTKLGWDTAGTTSGKSLLLTDLASWQAPDGLAESLKSTTVKFDLVHGNEHAQTLMDHVKPSAGVGTQCMYGLAVANKEGCAFIRAKAADSGQVVGSVILYRSGSSIAKHLPVVGKDTHQFGGLCCPVMRRDVPDRSRIEFGLMLLGVKQLKKQGLRSIQIDYLTDELLVGQLQSIGFTIQHSFDTLSSTAAEWSTRLVS